MFILPIGKTPGVGYWWR